MSVVFFPQNALVRLSEALAVRLVSARGEEEHSSPGRAVSQLHVRRVNNSPAGLPEVLQPAGSQWMGDSKIGERESGGNIADFCFLTRKRLRSALIKQQYGLYWIAALA